ncbi:MAG TPA: glycoside hydrolase family 28 protein [Rhizomicrobium sp.]|nr:glycoside hydrolase family 28 protein [Rhizomicrobium sp.]
MLRPFSEPVLSRRVLFGSLLCVFAMLLSPRAYSKGAVCDPAQYGARADGVTKDTKPIQAAIDACAGRGGGTVRLSKGVYLSAPIVLKDNITLEVTKGAKLLGSPDHTDYAEMLVFRARGQQSLISAVGAHNLAITGGGIIDGNGASWWVGPGGTRPNSIMGVGVFRPRLIVFDHCQHILIQGVTVQNSPSWQIIPYYSDDIVIRDIKVLAPEGSPNTDAIDPFASSNIMIDHVTADVGDDNIAIKSGAINSPGPDSPSSNITIRDCIFLHGHGLSIGSEIAGGARNIHAERIHFKGTDQGIRIKANRDRGNDVSDISFKDIEMEDVKTAILITEYYPGTPPEGDNPPQPITRLTPFFHNIRIENLKAVGSGVAGVIFGLPESPVKDITLRNLRITAAKGMVISDAMVTFAGVTVKAGQGKDIDVRPSAKVLVK